MGESETLTDAPAAGAALERELERVREALLALGAGPGER
jgi:hypothetical protein